MRVGAGIVGAMMLVLPVEAAETDPRIAAFAFEFVNTSPAPSTPEELDRLHRLDTQLKAALAEPGRYSPLDTAPLNDDNDQQTRGLTDHLLGATDRSRLGQLLHPRRDVHACANRVVIHREIVVERLHDPLAGM